MPPLKPLLLLGGLSLAGASGAFATDLIKADNTTALNAAGSYTDGAAVPAAADWIVFNNTLVNTTALATGGGLSVRGLRVVNPAGDLSLSLGNSTLSLGSNNSTSGSIDLSAATKNFSVTGTGTLRFFGSQPAIAVAAGRTLTVSTKVIVYNTGGGTLTVSGAGAVNLSGIVADGDAAGRTARIVQAGTGTLTLGGANTYTGGTDVGSGGTIAISQNFTLSGTNGIGIDATAGTHGSLLFGGTTLTYGGSLELDFSGAFSSGATFDLIGLGTGTSAGSFSSVSIVGSYAAGLVNNGSGVWSGAAGGTSFVFDQTSGDLTVSAIPEPATLALLSGILALCVGLQRRRAV